MLSQRQNVLRHLLGGPLCGTTRDPELGIRIAARVGELRKVGFLIYTRDCLDPKHQHRSKQIEYVLELAAFCGDACAICGNAGTLRYIGPMGDYGGLPVTCDKCGRKDLR